MSTPSYGPQTVGIPPGPPMFPGVLYAPHGYYGTSNIATTNNTAIYVPYVPLFGHTFTGMFSRVSVVGSTGALLRMGLFNDNGQGAPGQLIVDAGTVSATALGLVSVTGLSIPLSNTLLYWLAIGSQGGAATQPSLPGNDIRMAADLGMVGPNSSGAIVTQCWTGTVSAGFVSYPTVSNMTTTSALLVGLIG